MWTILSGIFGGLFRLVPEVFKYLDSKNERKHELDMQDKAIEFQRLKGDQVVGEIKAEGDNSWNAGAIDALKEAIKGQDTPSGIQWIDGFSKLMRPLITFQWVVLLYPGVIITTFILLLQAQIPVIDAMNKVFGEPEKAVVSFIIDFWFVGRVLDRGRK
jgi:hypothetical protein